MTTLPGLVVNLTLQHAQFVAGMNQANKSLGTLERTVKVATAAIGGFLGAMGARQIIDLGRRALDTAGNLNELAQRAGVTATQLQVLTVAGLQVGVSQEQLVTSLGQFGKRLGEAAQAAKGTAETTTALSKTLTQYNIAVLDSEGHTRATVDVLGDLAEVVQNAGSQSEQLRIAQVALGRAGAQLVPLLVQGSEGMEAFAKAAEEAGLILGADLINRADQASDAIATLQHAVSTGFQIGVVESFGDSVSSATDALKQAREAGEAFGQAVGTALRAGATAAAFVGRHWRELASAGAALVALRLAPVIIGIAGAMIQLVAAIKAGTTAMVIFNSVAGKNVFVLLAKGALSAAAAIGTYLALTKTATSTSSEMASELAAVNALFEEQEGALATAGAAAETTASSLEQLLKAAQLENIQLQELKRAHEGYGASVETVNGAIEIQNALVAAGITQQQAQESGLQDLLAANQQLRHEIDALSKAQDTQASAAAAAAERQAEIAEDLLAEPFRNAIQGIQSATTSLFEDILSGGIDSFEQLAASIKQTFIRLAAELASLSLFRMLAGGGVGFGGLFGAGAALANPAGATMRMGAHGMLAGGGVTSTAGAAAVAGPGLLMPGLLGGLGGALLAPMLFGGGLGTTVGGGLGGAGGAIGGALLGSLFPGVGTVLGAVGGGLLGGLGGGFLGSLFGGGGSSGNEASIGGGFGRAGAGGTGEAAKFVVDFDKKMSALLNDRQMELADQALRAAKSVSVKYGDEGLSEGDRARLAAGRVAPVAGALGFRKQAFEGLGAEEGLAQLQEAIELEKTIQDLTSAVTPFKRSLLDLREQFAAAESRAKELGISTRGMGKALRESEKELYNQRNLERASLRLQLKAIIGSGNASQELAVAIAAIRLQFQGLREDAEALGVPLNLVRAAERAAIKQAKEAAAQLHAQRQFERAGLQLQLRAIIGSGSASRELAVAIANIRLQFHGLRKDAEDLGVSLKLVAQAEKAAIQQAKEASRAAEREADRQRQADREAAREADRQRRTDRATARSRIVDLTAGSDYERELAQINQTFREAYKLAREYNLGERGLAAAKREAIRALKLQQQAEIDALALSVVEPFLALSDPLRAFVDDLERSLLSPVELFKVAQADFRDTARRAQAGDTDAIQQLDEAGRFFIEQAGRFGASPAQVEATQEVLHATEGVTKQVDISMREATRGIRDEVRLADRHNVDTLKELGAKLDDVVREIKRMRT